MTTQLEQEFKDLINIAIIECAKAIEGNDPVLADFFKEELFDLLSQLHENTEYMSIAQ